MELLSSVYCQCSQILHHCPFQSLLSIKGPTGGTYQTFKNWELMEVCPFWFPPSPRLLTWTLSFCPPDWILGAFWSQLFCPPPPCPYWPNLRSMTMLGFLNSEYIPMSVQRLYIEHDLRWTNHVSDPLAPILSFRRVPIRPFCSSFLYPLPFFLHSHQWAGVKISGVAPPQARFQLTFPIGTLI